MEIIPKNEADALLKGRAQPTTLRALVSQLPADAQSDAEMLTIGAATSYDCSCFWIELTFILKELNNRAQILGKVPISSLEFNHFSIIRRSASATECRYLI